MEQKSVYITYRRDLSTHLALLIYQALKINGWNVFLDLKTVDSGDLDQITLNQIGAHAHFILLISKDSLKGCANYDDWLLREIEEAVRLHRNIIMIIEKEASFTEEIGHLLQRLRILIIGKSRLSLPHFLFDALIGGGRSRFLRSPDYVQIQETPVDQCAEVQRRIANVEAQIASQAQPISLSPPISEAYSPNYFYWIVIPDKGYSVAKYPVTNEQFARFIESGAYQNKAYWTDLGWQQCELNKWTEPLTWCYTGWNNDTQPVVGVSWYEAVAFCLWVSETTGEKIMLPTEEQWQYAAQGDDGRAYPWGNHWNRNLCNNDVDHRGIDKTTPVDDYEGTGDSPFGVVDMAGNIWEWCLTDWKNKSDNIYKNATLRILRGGSFYDDNKDVFRCDYRFQGLPVTRAASFGFRVCRFNKDSLDI